MSTDFSDLPKLIERAEKATTVRIFDHRVDDPAWNAVYAALEPFITAPHPDIARGRRLRATNEVLRALQSKAQA